MEFYIDTAIFIDAYEERTGFGDIPLHEYAMRLFAHIRLQKHTLLVSDILLTELEKFYTLDEIRGIFLIYRTKGIRATLQQRREARQLALERNLPYGDTLHAVLARDRKCIFITRDNHFKKLQDIITPYKPEEILP